VNNPATTKISTDQLLDSLFLYATQTYYWNDQLPPAINFDPHNYHTSDPLSSLSAELFQLTRYPKNEKGELYEQSLKPVYDYSGHISWQPDNETPKYSYITKLNSSASYANLHVDKGITPKKTALLAINLNGQDNSLGFLPALIILPKGTSYANITVASDSTLCIVQWVTTGSPAYNAGLRRGDLIYKINGIAYKDWTNINIQSLNDAIQSDQLTLTIRERDTETQLKEIKLEKKLYDFNPIFKDTLLNISSKKIGYLALQSFTSNTEEYLNEAFKTRLKNANELVIDLRYNGGGYVQMAEYLDNLIAPQSADKKIMYTTYFNQTMIDKKALLLKNIPLDYDYPEQGSWFDLDYTPDPDNSQMTHRFNKSGITAGLSNLTRVYFIVSSSTASASELAINNLKPYLQVILIGAALADDGDRTFGKPVGFFEIRFGDYSLFMPNFETKNARNEGAYYTGIPTDIKMFDDLADDFGNPEEACFAAAIAISIIQP